MLRTDPSGQCTSWVIDAVASQFGGELRLRCVYRGWGHLNYADGAAYLRGLAGGAAEMAAAGPAMPGTPQFLQQAAQGAWQGYTLATQADARASAWQTAQHVANPRNWPGLAWDSLTHPFRAFAHAFACDDSEALGRAAFDAGVTIVGVAESAGAARALARAIPARYTALRQTGASRVQAAMQATAGAMQAQASVDFLEQTGRLGGVLYGERRLALLKQYLHRRGVDLFVGDEYLDFGQAGGFAIYQDPGRRPAILLGTNPTQYEVWHELSHYLHYRRIGREAYLKLPRSPNGIRVDAEQFVFDMLENNERRWFGFTDDERIHASTYILENGGIR